jgi:hypothetical protein
MTVLRPRPFFSGKAGASVAATERLDRSMVKFPSQLVSMMLITVMELRLEQPSPSDRLLGIGH